jgi:hypothetical protein
MYLQRPRLKVKARVKNNVGMYAAAANTVCSAHGQEDTATKQNAITTAPTIGRQSNESKDNDITCPRNK